MAQLVAHAETAPLTPNNTMAISDTTVHHKINIYNDRSITSSKSLKVHSRWTPTGRRRLSFPRKRKLPTVRLGGGGAGGSGGKKPRRGFFLVRLFRRVKLRTLKKKYGFMLKKLKEYYRGILKDLMEAGGTIECLQQRILLETSFAVPVMGLSFNTFPTSHHYAA